MLAFFGRLLEDKLRFSRSADNPWGFFDRELTKNVQDSKEIFDCGPPDDPRHPVPWPPDAPRFHEAVLAYREACEPLALRLTYTLAQCLGVSGDSIDRALSPSPDSFLRLNSYPTAPLAPGNRELKDDAPRPLGIHPHTDAGALTVLLQDDQPGLEVFHRGEWHLIEPRRGALVVNIGDVVQVWSNDRYCAGLHRVRASVERARSSAAFFLNPAREASYAPLPGTYGSDDPARYRTISWREFRSRRSAGDYADIGQEVQISDYRTAGTQARAADAE